MKNAYYNFPKYKVTSDVLFFVRPQQPKSKSICFTIVEDKGSHKTFTFEKLELENFDIFSFKNDSDRLFIVDSCCLSTYQWIDWSLQLHKDIKNSKTSLLTSTRQQSWNSGKHCSICHVCSWM